MKRIASVIITEPKEGQWKLTVMSLSEPRKTLHYYNVDDALEGLKKIMASMIWEQLG